MTRTRIKILCVEDHRDTAVALCRLLAQHGYDVVNAHTFEDAIRLIRENGPFPILICDIQLPDGSGLDLMRIAREQYGEVRGIVVSGHGSPEDISRSTAAGFAAHLVKPVDFKTVVAAVEGMVRDLRLDHLGADPSGDTTGKLSNPVNSSQLFVLPDTYGESS